VGLCVEQELAVLEPGIVRERDDAGEKTDDRWKVVRPIFIASWV
jgi:hypothetical protein